MVDQPRFGLVTDVDGTISPIVADPDAAQVTPRSRQLLHLLAAQLPLVAVISGRAAADVQARVDLPGLVYIGNHGLERWQNGQISLEPAAAAHRPALETAVAAAQTLQEPGLWIEDKGATLSVHYRNTADPAAAKRRLQQALTEIAAARDLRLFAGRMVFELRPPIEAHKGTAFRQLVREYDLDSALFIGDDTTDVDAIRAARELRRDGRCRAVGIAVLSADTPPPLLEAADCYADGVPDVAALLAWIADMRSASRT